MERIDRIWKHPLWQKAMAEITEWERERIFCRHTAAHFLDVARLAYIESLEQGLDLPKEVIYAAALLHDIGRGRQYAEGIPHDRAGAALAEEILPACGFSGEEQNEIIHAISDHRTQETGVRSDLSGLLYRADKKSRMCMFCKAEPECNWEPQKKNKNID